MKKILGAPANEHRLRALILGAAAGGGLPQWNCGCANCAEARLSGGRIRPQTQSSIAVSVDGINWAVLNASPDIRTQLQVNRQMHPNKVRDTPVRAVVLTNGDIDHIAGLLILREKQAFSVYATPAILEIISANRLFDALDRELVTFREIVPGQSFRPVDGIEMELFSVPGKVPLYMEGDEVDTRLIGDQTVGVEIRTQNSTMYYIPGCSKLTPELEVRLTGASVVMFDGTVYEDDEMARQGVGSKTGARMGHMSMSGPDGSIEKFKPIPVARKIFVHINNTNPVWDPESAARQHAESEGWEIGYDGMEILSTESERKQA